MPVHAVKQHGYVRRMVDAHRFSLRFDGREYAISVDGEDVSAQLAAVEVRADTRDMPHVVLHLAPTKAWPAVLETLAKVEVGVPAAPGTAAAEFLAAMDAAELERVALARPDLENSPHGVTRAMLDQLVEWARGS